MQHDRAESPRQSGADPYHYRNTRPVSVFMLALIAAIVALLMVGFGWSAIGAGTNENRLPPPPDLKKTVERVETRGRAAVDRIDQKIDAAVVAATGAAAEPQEAPPAAGR